MNSLTSVTRPTFEHWLRDRKMNYVLAARALMCSRETLRRYCLPFDAPQRRFPNKGLLARIVTFTDGQITGHDFLPPALSTSTSRAGAAASEQVA